MDQMIKDLVEISIGMVKKRLREVVTFSLCSEIVN